MEKLAIDVSCDVQDTDVPCPLFGSAVPLELGLSQFDTLDNLENLLGLRAPATRMPFYW